MPKRIIPDGDEGGVFHLTSRVVDRRRIFDARQRRHFLKLALAHAAFGGIDVVTWCVMGNHFHLLVRIAPGSHSAAMAMEAPEVLERMAYIYPAPDVEEFRQILERCSSPEEQNRLLDPYRRRMASIADFMKGVKQRFARWYNLGTGRTGTLWEDRYHSVVLEEAGDASQSGLGPLAKIVAAYIDLNPMRAGLASTPRELGLSGFSAACHGNAAALRGLALLHGVSAGTQAKSQTVVLHERLLESEWRGFAARGGHTDTEEAKAELRKVFSHSRVLGKESYVRKHAGETRSGLPRRCRRLPSGNDHLLREKEKDELRIFGSKHSPKE